MTRWLRLATLAAACAVAVTCAFGCCQAAASALPSTSLGVNAKTYSKGSVLYPTDLSTASHQGVGVARFYAIQGTNMDSVVQLLAKSHMRLYPTLGLPCPAGTSDCTSETQIPPAQAASEMAAYIKAFAQRYGPGGTFWSENPSLPYLPVESFEIGNEPNIRMIWVQDSTHLHWPDPSNSALADDADYAEVYDAARGALHAVDPSGKAVVGGLADSASDGVDVQSDEALLAALPRGQVDAVGYHPWVYDVSDALLEPDTSALRTWMDQNGFAGVPLDVNEFGACDKSSSAQDNQTCRAPTQSSATWGSVVAAYTRWALCTPSMDVENVQPFTWGGTPTSDADIWLPLVTGTGVETPYGQDFLSVAKTLTTTGCSASAPEGKAARPNAAKPMGLRLVRIRKRGQRVLFTVLHVRNSGTVTATVTRQGRTQGRHGKRGHKYKPRRLRGRRRNPTTTTFNVKLPVARWTLLVSGKPALGYAKPKSKQRRFTTGA